MKYEWMVFGAFLGVLGSVTNGDGKLVSLVYGGVSGAAIMALMVFAFGAPTGDTVLLYALASLVSPYVIETAKRLAKSILEKI